MYISSTNIDDLLSRTFRRILKDGIEIEASRGLAKEKVGVLLQLTNPRSRLSRTEKKGTVYSALGELLWYLAASNRLDFIKYYIPLYESESEDKRTIYGAYGPRLFKLGGSINQVLNVIDLLKNKPHSRRAVIQLFDAKDIEKRSPKLGERKEIPCTCTLQFLLRKRQLHMITTMRSNDAFLGLPHDIFAFTMLQEIIAKTLGVKLGAYKHSVGSLHIYQKDIPGIRQYLEEGIQGNIYMPQMPDGDPWPAINILLKLENKIRKGEHADIDAAPIDHYWKDLARLLKIFSLSASSADTQKISKIRKSMFSQVYTPYIIKRQKRRAVPKQLQLSSQILS